MKVRCIQSHICDVVDGNTRVVLPGSEGALFYMNHLAKDVCHIQWLSGLQGDYSVDEALAVTNAKRSDVLAVLRAKYPWLYLYSGDGKLVGIGPTNPAEDYPRYSHADIRSLAEQLRGWVMQKDDGYSPAFTLYNFQGIADGGDQEG